MLWFLKTTQSFAMYVRCVVWLTCLCMCPALHTFLAPNKFGSRLIHNNENNFHLVHHKGQPKFFNALRVQFKWFNEEMAHWYIFIWERTYMSTTTCLRRILSLSTTLLTCTVYLGTHLCFNLFIGLFEKLTV